MPATPRVSVLMPVYNVARFVRRTVDSILAQTLGDFEFIIIDDGSTDGSTDVLRGFERADRRIRLVSRPNTGYVVALNEGLGLVRADLIARIDADDLNDPRRFELQVARMDADPGLVALGSCATAIDDEDRPLGDYSPPLAHEEIEASHLRGGCALHHPVAMLRTEAVRRVGGYRPETMPCEDLDLWIRLGEVGRLANLPEKLLTKRLHDHSTAATRIDRQPALTRDIVTEAWRRRGLPGRPTLPSRPLTSKADLHRQWGWMALRAGHVKTARHYAMKVLKARPLERSSWRFAMCCLRGR